MLVVFVNTNCSGGLSTAKHFALHPQHIINPEGFIKAMLRIEVDRSHDAHTIVLGRSLRSCGESSTPIDVATPSGGDSVTTTSLAVVMPSDQKSSSEGTVVNALDVMLSFRLQTKLPPFVEKFNTPDRQASNSTSSFTSEGILSFTFLRSPREVRHLMVSLSSAFPCLMLPPWITDPEKSAVNGNFAQSAVAPIHNIVTQSQPIASQAELLFVWVECCVSSIAVVEEVILSEVFMSFVDTQLCPSGRFETLRVKRPLHTDSHPLSMCFQLERQLQPIAVQVKSPFPTTASAESVETPISPVGSSSDLGTHIVQLRSLSASIYALVAELNQIRQRSVKDLCERATRRKAVASNFPSTLTTDVSRSIRRNLCSAINSKSSKGHVDERRLRLGDRVFHNSFGSGAIAYLGPASAGGGKHGDRCIGVVWDTVLPKGGCDGTTDDGVRHFVCAPNCGSFLKGSHSLFTDPLDDMVLSAIVTACVAIDVGALAPSNNGSVWEESNAPQLKNPSRYLGLLSFHTAFLQTTAQWISKLLHVHRTLTAAEQWVELKVASTNSPPNAEVAAVRRHTTQLNVALFEAVLDFQSMWACYSTARHVIMNDLAQSFETVVREWGHFSVSELRAAADPASSMVSTAPHNVSFSDNRDACLTDAVLQELRLDDFARGLQSSLLSYGL